jgi:hypothetical protein
MTTAQTGSLCRWVLGAPTSGWHAPGESRAAAERDSTLAQLRQGRYAPSRFVAYQDEDRLTFSTFIPGCGASMSMLPPT